MDEKKQVTQTSVDTVARTQFWGTIALSGLFLLVCAYFFTVLYQQPGTPVVYMGTAVFLFGIVIAITSIVLVLRRRQELGLKLAFYALLMLGLMIAFLFQGRVITASLSILLISAITIRWLFPRLLWRWYAGATAAAIALMWLVEWVIVPSWRIQLEAVSIGPAAAVLFGIITITIGGTQAWRSNLRNKMIIAFLVATIIPLAILAYLNDRSTRATLTDDANQALLSAASQSAAQVDSFIIERVNTARAEAQFAAVIDYILLPASERAGTIEETRLIKFIYARLTQDPVYITSVAIYDINGVTLADTFSNDVGVNKSDRSWFQKAVATGLPYASTVEFSQENSEASLYFSAPVRDAAGKIIGVVRTRYNAAILQSIVTANSNLLGQDSLAILMDTQNNVRLAHGTNPAIIFKSVIPLDAATVSGLQARRLLPPGTPGSTNLPGFASGLSNVDNNPFFTTELQVGAQTETEQVAVVNFKTQPWRLVYAQAQSVFLAPINAQARNNIILTLIIAVAVIGFALFMAQTLSGPITRLTQTAEKIAEGDINIQAKVETSDEIGALAGTFNRMTQQLRDFIINLEERVAARTKDLATVAEVGTATATILETDKLLQEVVNLSKERFNLYHAHIYLLDESAENLVLASGAGEAGRQMKAKGLSIPLNREQSLVARAAREQKGVTVNDVTKAPDFLPNPLLPDTRSELAVPMIVGGKVIGVFDVQSDEAGRFTEADISIQTTLASQVATSIQNVRSFEQSKTQAEFESLVNTIGQKIQRATTMEDTLQTAIRELGAALGASRVSANISARQDGGNEASRN